MTRPRADSFSIVTMKRTLGFALPMFDLETLTPLTVKEIAIAAIQAEAAGFDALWLMDHIFLLQNGKRVSGHDPIVVLGYLAAVTTTAAIGVLVLCNTFRQPGQLAREAAALADASGHRFVLGLGCGSQPLEHEACGLPYHDRVSRLEETLEVLRPTMAGETVAFSGRFLEMRDCSIVTTAPPPPILVAASGPRMMRITASRGDGWVSDFYGPDPSRFRRDLAAFEAALGRAGRPRDEVVVVTGLQALVTKHSDLEDVADRARKLGPPSRLPLSERLLLADEDSIARTIHDYWASGADHVVLVPSPWHFGRFDRRAIETASLVVQRAKS